MLKKTYWLKSGLENWPIQLISQCPATYIYFFYQHNEYPVRTNSASYFRLADWKEIVRMLKQIRFLEQKHTIIRHWPPSVNKIFWVAVEARCVEIDILWPRLGTPPDSYETVRTISERDCRETNTATWSPPRVACTSIAWT